VVPAGSRPAPVPEKLEEPTFAKAEFTSIQPSNNGSPPVARLKYEMCKNWRTKGACPYGDKCLFAHGENEISRRTTAPVAEVTPKVETKSTEKVESSEKSDDAVTVIKIEEDLTGIKKRGCSESRKSGSPPVTFRPIDSQDCKVGQLLTSPRAKARDISCEKLIDTLYEH
jgi:hypothetical protein